MLTNPVSLHNHFLLWFSVESDELGVAMRKPASDEEPEVSVGI